MAVAGPDSQLGTQPVIADVHRVLLRAIETVLPGAAWQRYRVHFVRNALGV